MVHNFLKELTQKDLFSCQFLDVLNHLIYSQKTYYIKIYIYTSKKDDNWSYCNWLFITERCPHPTEKK